MTFHRLLTFVIYAAIICGAIGHIGYLWPELTRDERIEICAKYGFGVVALGAIVFSLHTL